MAALACSASAGAALVVPCGANEMTAGGAEAAAWVKVAE